MKKDDFNIFYYTLILTTCLVIVLNHFWPSPVPDHEPVPEYAPYLHQCCMDDYIADNSKFIVNGYLEFDTLHEALEYAQDNISGEIIMMQVIIGSPTVEITDEPNGN